jgi:hypothetical protein
MVGGEDNEERRIRKEITKDRETMKRREGILKEIIYSPFYFLLQYV